MRIQLLPSTFDGHGRATAEQRLTCFLIDDCVAIDAGSIAIALTAEQRADKRAVEVRYLIDRTELAALGERLGWAPRRSAVASGIER